MASAATTIFLFALSAALYNYYSNAPETTIMDSPWNAEKAERVLAKYLDSRQEGKNISEITNDIFQVHLPNGKLGLNCYPFVCSQVFRAYADVVVQDNEVLSDKQPRDMSPGDVIYVHSESFNFFQQTILPQLSQPFFLINHGSDSELPMDISRLSCNETLDSPLLIHWFANSPNPSFTGHPKLSLLPYGFKCSEHLMRNLEQALRMSIPKTYDGTKVRNSKTVVDERPTLLYKNLMVTGHHKVLRQPYLDAFHNLGRWAEGLNLGEYFEDLASSKFTLAPRGIAIDCFRNYETILFRSLPIVDGNLSPMLTEEVFKQAPTYILPQNWRSAPPTRTDLLAFAPSAHGLKMGRSVVLAQYWLDKIDQARRTWH